MYKRIFPFYLAFLLLLTNCSVARNDQPNQSGPFVVLKLDDLWFEDGLVHPGWVRVIDFLNEENIKGTIGIVGNSLEVDNESYITWIKDRYNEGHEIWHHGFCHCRHKDGEIEIREFRGKGLEEQCESIANTQQLVQDKLGITLHSFGAPYNSTDESTAIALSRIPDIKVWMYKDTELPTEKFLLNRIKEVNIEYPVHNPDFEQFKAGYKENRSEPVLVIQGHPRSWTKDRSRFDNFKKIVYFLKKQKVQFITPYEYYQLQTKK